MGRNGAYTPHRTVQAEANIKTFVATHHCIKEPLPYPLEVDITFFFKNRKEEYHVSRPDLDNLCKLVLDALGPKINTYLGVRTQQKGVLFNDDAQVCKLNLEKVCHPIQGIWVRWHTLVGSPTVIHPMERDL